MGVICGGGRYIRIIPPTWALYAVRSVVSDITPAYGGDGRNNGMFPFVWYGLSDNSDYWKTVKPVWFGFSSNKQKSKKQAS